MKKIILAACLIFAAQLTSAQKINWGVKAGVGASTFTGDVDNADPLLGYQGGVEAEIKLTQKFAIQPEVLFSAEGGKTSFHYEDATGELNTNETVRLNYINVPVLAKYSFSKKFSLEAGPQFGFLVSAKSKYDVKSDVGGVLIDESGTEDIKDNLNTFNVGAALGATYFVSENIFVQARAYQGLTKINKETDEETSGRANGKIRNAGVQLSVGYKF